MIGQVQDIVRAAQVTLQDEGGDRWPAAELVRYARDGTILLLQVMPWERSVSIEFVPAVGARQELPADAIKPLEIECNAQGRMRAMTRVERYDLSAVDRDWLSRRPEPELIHWMFSQNEPRSFYVYPPASDKARLELTYCQYPPAIDEPVGPLWSDVSGDTGIEAKWNTALLDYVLYRAWSKDAEYAANAQLSGGHLSAFLAAIGAQSLPQPAT